MFYFHLISKLCTCIALIYLWRKILENEKKNVLVTLPNFREGWIVMLVQEQVKCPGEDRAATSARQRTLHWHWRHCCSVTGHHWQHACSPFPASFHPAWGVAPEWLRLGSEAMNSSQFGGGSRPMAFVCRRRGAPAPAKSHIAKAVSFLGRRVRCQIAGKSIKCTRWSLPHESIEHLQII